MRALIDKGWIKAANFKNSRNKIAYMYLLTPHGLEEKARLTTRFLQIKIREYEALKDRDRADPYRRRRASRNAS